MDNGEDDDDLKLVQASAGLLADLEQDLPKLLWKADKAGAIHKRAHKHVKTRHLAHIIHLIEPFQGEPQLLDAKLKSVLPPIVDAYLDLLRQDVQRERASEHVELQSAICSILYTLCKVRGYKVIVGFLKNEPKYLEPILEALERTMRPAQEGKVQWEVPYVLLLWLSHLLLTPFDLSSISTKQGPLDAESSLLHQLPPLPARCLRVGRAYLYTSTKAQDAAAAMLVRLCIRPDVLPLGVVDSLVASQLSQMETGAASSSNVYHVLGSLRLVAGVSASVELGHLLPTIYRTCENAFAEDTDTRMSSNAVAKKLAVKIFRNIAVLSLRPATANGPLMSFFQTASVLENVIDYLLRSLSDRDTPVRYAAAKAISLIILELEPEMGHEVIQAVLDSFKVDMPRPGAKIEFSTANPLRWHGLTLAMAHTLFKRSAAPEQLPDILNSLISALQFHQRTATGSTLGVNVRDAANFGIWSLARRYTTAELLSVPANVLRKSNQTVSEESIIQMLALQLILSACLDPAGNIRRGSSAALQEVVGRHPNQVAEGISLVQTVDYQAVSLRSRAMVDVVANAAALHPMYWQTLLEGLSQWRGLGSADVPSRDSAATSIAKLATFTPPLQIISVLQRIQEQIKTCPTQDVEGLHGYTMTVAALLQSDADTLPKQQEHLDSSFVEVLDTFELLQAALVEFTPRMLRSEYPAALARFITALCNTLLTYPESESVATCLQVLPLAAMDSVVDRLLTRPEERILETVPSLTLAFLQLKRKLGVPLGCLEAHTLAGLVSRDGSKSTMQSAGRAIALGALASSYDAPGLNGDNTAIAITALRDLVGALNVDSRVTGAKALRIAAESIPGSATISAEIAATVFSAIHRGLNDYTIDERGDVGSLVRLQCIACTSCILGNEALRAYEDLVQILEADIYRLSLEKLDRVRLQAAQCRKQHLSLTSVPSDVASVSSVKYFEAALKPLSQDALDHRQKAVLEGCISCAGVGAEAILQASRQVLFTQLDGADVAHLERLLADLAVIVKTQLLETPNLEPALELLGFLFDMQIPHRLPETSTFKWRNLLSIVQKSHHKSNDIGKILAAVRVYIGLTDIPSIRGETLKKLGSMLRTNPYPRVRMAVAEALYVVTAEESLTKCDWARAPSQHVEVLQRLQD